MEIEGYENYLIYEDGRVWNKKFNKFLKLCNHSCGYYYVGLHKDGKRKNHKIHRLIALHYIPNPDNYPQVDHINRIRKDNRIENLRWVTNQMNCQNQSKSIVNTSGHTNIYFIKKHKLWKFQRMINRKHYHKYFKSKIDALCYKYIFLLKIKSCIL